MDFLDMPQPTIQSYDQLQADRDFWKNKYFELYQHAHEMISTLAERNFSLNENHAVDENWNHDC